MTTQPEFMTPSTSANASIMSASCSKSTSHKQGQSDLDAQYSKSMESLQQLIKSRTENQKAAIPDDEDDIFGKMVACECRKIKNSKIKRQLKKNSTICCMKQLRKMRLARNMCCSTSSCSQTRHSVNSNSFHFWTISFTSSYLAKVYIFIIWDEDVIDLLHL